MMTRFRLVGFLALGFSFAAISDGQAAQKVRWTAYRSNVLNLMVSVPADWAPVKKGSALAFRYDDLSGGTAAIGILKSQQADVTIEQAAEKEMEREGHPDDWSRSLARIDGHRAVKIVGTSSQMPDMRIVHYYVEAPQGMYLVQCQAPIDRWNTFGPLFASILGKIKFTY